MPVRYDQLITQYRQSWDLTQEHFAEHFDVVARCVQRWEQGVTPGAKNRQKLALCEQAGEDAKLRRDFFRGFLAVSLPFAALSQAPQLHQFLEALEPSTTHLSVREELGIVEMLTKTCWQRLPHVADVVERRYLDDVRAYRQMLASWLASSPGSSFDERLTSALSEVEYVEATLLYELKRPEEAAQSYQAAKQRAHAAGNLLLEAVGLTWFGNFLIDTRRAHQASPPLEQARQLAEKTGAPPIVRAWIAATEADALAHQGETYKSEVALSRAARWQDALELEQEAYPVSYDRPWSWGFTGTVYAHLGQLQDAYSALEQGLAQLDPAWTFRRLAFSIDLLIVHSLDHHVEAACHAARQAARGAAQARAPMTLQRIQDAAHTFLKPWKDSPMVKDLSEELRALQAKLLSE